MFYAGNEYLAEIYLFRVINGNTKSICEICSTLTTNTLERRR